jgi:hypothetical protein
MIDRGDLVLPGLDGSRDVLKREDIIDSIVRRWRHNGFDCPDVYACLDGESTPTLARWLLEAVTGEQPACPEARLRETDIELPKNIQN